MKKIRNIKIVVIVIGMLLLGLVFFFSIKDKFDKPKIKNETNSETKKKELEKQEPKQEISSLETFKSSISREIYEIQKEYIKQDEYLASEGINFNFFNGVKFSSATFEDLNYKDEVIHNGKLKITDNGVSLALHNGEYCAYKTEEDEKISFNLLPKEECVLENPKTFLKMFGGCSYDEYDDILIVEDGYIVIGMVCSTDGDMAFLDTIEDDDRYTSNIVIKYDFEGDIVWKKVMREKGKPFHRFDSLQKEDDGFIVIGSFESNVGKITKKLLKYDLNGNLIWEKNLEKNTTSITKYNNEGYLLKIGGNIVKMDSNYNFKWEKPLNYSCDKYIIFSNNDIGFFNYEKDNEINGKLNYYFLRLDSNGNELEKFEIQGLEDYRLNDAILVEDGYILLSDYGYGTIIKIDFKGNLIYKKESPKFKSFAGIMEDKDGFIVFGSDLSLNPPNIVYDAKSF